MTIHRGKRVAIAVTIAGLATAAIAAVALRERVSEEWHLRNLGARDEQIVEKSIFHLSQIRSVRAVPGLIGLLHDKNRRLALSAADALGRIGPPARAAIPDLIWLLEENGEDKAAVALAEFGAEAREAAISVLLAICRRELQSSARIKSTCGNASDGFLCALHAISRIDPDAPDSVSIFLEALKDPEVPVRQEAARCLGLQKDPRSSLPALVDALRDPDGAVRRQAVESLGKYGRDSLPALDALKALDSDPDADVRSGSRSAVERIQCRPQ